MRKFLLIAMLGSIIPAVGCTPKAERPAAQSPSQLPTLAAEDRVTPAKAEAIPTPSVTVECSTTKLRTAVASVSWQDTSPTQNLRLDIAAAKQGFDRGQYLKVQVDATAKAVPSAGLRSNQAEDVMGRTLDLQIETPSRAPEARAAANPEELADVRVSDLEPGVVYYFRVAHPTDGEWIAGPPVRVEAPTCVADIVGEER